MTWSQVVFITICMPLFYIVINFVVARLSVLALISKFITGLKEVVTGE